MSEALRQLTSDAQNRFQADPESAVMTFEDPDFHLLMPLFVCRICRSRARARR